MNLYIVLGVDRDASVEEVKRAYRRLARKYHPDINPGDRAAAALFRRIADAYETLSDPDRRRQYDLLGDLPSAAADEPALEFEGFDFSVRPDARQASTFSELFADALRSEREGRRGPERGADLHVTVTFGFEEALRGARRPVTLTRLERCGPCRGAGYLQGPESTCPRCDGVGQVRLARGHMVFARVCSGCRGRGHVRHVVCAACGGEGVGVRTEVLTIDTPAGIGEGNQFTVPGEGHAGRRGGEPGDLRVTVAIEPHPFFRRDGDDVLVEVPVGIHEAALGARIDVPTPDGPVRLKVPPGTQSGQVFRVQGRGAPSLRGGGRGDLVVSIRLVLPKVLDERSKELMREFGARQPDNVRAHLGV